MTRVADDPGLVRLFAVQAENCAKMGAPFNARVCATLADTLDDTSTLGRRVLRWPNENRGNDLVPLRCCAGFHALARARRVPALLDVYPPALGSDDLLRAALRAAIACEDAFLAGYLDSAPQTNEIGRSAILLGGLLTIAERLGKAISLYEIGASAGLNLLFDRWSYDLGEAGTWGAPDAPVRTRSDWSGAAPSLGQPLTVVARAASDLSPLHADDPNDRERLLSFIWPDQSERLARTEAAFDVAARSGIRVDKADARDWVVDRLAPSRARAGTTTVLWHSVFIQYVDPPVRAALLADIRQRGAAATDDAPFAWLAMEAKTDARERCELRLTLWPGGETVSLADVDWHGRSARWHPP